MQPSRSKFLLSIMSALIVGVGVAYTGIAGIQIVKNPQLITQVGNSISAFSDSFSSKHFLSSEVLYAAEEVREEVGDDITLTGETLSSGSVDSSGAAISALAYSVQSLDKNNVLVEKDSDRLLPIASVTKLATAVVAKKLFNEDDLVTITSRVLATEGSTGNLRLNEKYKIKEILYPLLMVSSNDASEALAQGYDAKKGKGAFIKEMNAWVQSIGAYRTSFRDPSGLSPHNLSTAHDLSIIAKWIKDNEPEIFDITLTKAKTIRTHTWTNPTHFLNLSSYTGGKNGYIPEASLTNISLFELGEPKRLYSVILLGSKNRDKDTLAALNKAVK